MIQTFYRQRTVHGKSFNHKTTILSKDEVNRKKKMNGKQTNNDVDDNNNSGDPK